jgi:hypothetical protein
VGAGEGEFEEEKEVVVAVVGNTESCSGRVGRLMGVRKSHWRLREGGTSPF